jgi:hypothetical protein
MATIDGCDIGDDVKAVGLSSTSDFHKKGIPTMQLPAATNSIDYVYLSPKKVIRPHKDALIYNDSHTEQQHRDNKTCCPAMTTVDSGAPKRNCFGL